MATAHVVGRPANSASPLPALGALIRFGRSGTGTVTGELGQGAGLVVDYDPDRLPGCRTRHAGMLAWDLYGHIVFWPSGQSVTGNFIRHLDEGPTGPRVLDPPEPVPWSVTVPADAVRAELWFDARSVTDSCVAWDSRDGQNYQLEVAPAGPTPQVRARPGAVPSLEMVNIAAEAANKRDVFPDRADRSPEGKKNLQTWLGVTAWVANRAYVKSVWVDVHVFDDHDALCWAETFPLAWSGPGGGGGDLFRIDQRVYQGFTATPGSVSPRPDARTVQYRLYYAVAGGAEYTDRILHHLHVAADQSIR